MLRTLFFFCVTTFAVIFSVSTFASDKYYGYNFKQVKKHQKYFKQQSLPYIKPKGCSKASLCSLSADFNNDGSIDYVAIYEYAGSDNRTGDNYLDLVFIYSDKQSFKFKQQIFTRVGSIGGNNKALIKLEIQKKGTMKLPIGKVELDTIAVNVITKGKTANLYFPTFYWDGELFRSISKEDD